MNVEHNSTAESALLAAVPGVGPSLAVLNNTEQGHRALEHVAQTAERLGRDVLHGAVVECEQHPDRIAADILIGGALGLATVAAPEVMIPVGILLTGAIVGANASKIVHTVGGWAHDTAVVYDSAHHTSKEQADADKDLQGVGAFGAHFVAGMVGSVGAGSAASAGIAATFGTRAAMADAVGEFASTRLVQLQSVLREPLRPDILPPEPLPQLSASDLALQARNAGLLQLQKGPIGNVRRIPSQGRSELAATQASIGEIPVVVRSHVPGETPGRFNITEARHRQELAISQIHSDDFGAGEFPLTAARQAGQRTLLIQEHLGPAFDDNRAANTALFESNPEFHQSVEQAVVSQLIYGAEAHGGNLIVSSRGGGFAVHNIDMDLRTYEVPEPPAFDVNHPMRPQWFAKNGRYPTLKDQR